MSKYLRFVGAPLMITVVFCLMFIGSPDARKAVNEARVAVAISMLPQEKRELLEMAAQAVHQKEAAELKAQSCSAKLAKASDALQSASKSLQEAQVALTRRCSAVSVLKGVVN